MAVFFFGKLLHDALDERDPKPLRLAIVPFVVPI